MSTLRHVPPAPPRRFYHLEWPHRKHEENSEHGIETAKRLGFPWVDLDNCHSASGISWNNHWPEPLAHDGFKDPLHKLGRHARFATLDDKAVRRLYAETDGKRYRIRPSIHNVLFALSLGIKVEFELKDRHYDLEFFTRLAKVVTRAGYSIDDINVKALTPFAIGLEWAHMAGFTTILLSHGDKAPARWTAFVTYHRGGVEWVE